MSMEDCVSYLLDEMPEDERWTFEKRLDRDEELRKELRESTDDLANFAEASVVALKPSDSVWYQVRGQISLEPRSEAAVWVFPWKVFLAVAACLLLGLNLFQISYWFGKKEFVADNGGRIESESFVDDRLEIERLEADESELEGLRNQVAELDGVLEEALTHNGERQSRIRKLQVERGLLESRIEYLERNYIDLVELTEPLLNSLEEGSGSGVRILQLVTRVPDSSIGLEDDVWKNVVASLENDKIAVLGLPRSERFESEIREDIQKILESDSLYAVVDDRVTRGGDLLYDSEIPTHDNEKTGDTRPDPLIGNEEIENTDINNEQINWRLGDSDRLNPLDPGLPSDPNREIKSVDGRLKTTTGPDNPHLGEPDSEFDSTSNELGDDRFIGLDPYAIAYVNEVEGVGLLSFGNLPELAVDERMVIWATDGDGLVVEAIGELPPSLGSSANVGVRLDDDASLGGGFLVSVEAVEEELPAHPGVSILLETQNSP